MSREWSVGPARNTVAETGLESVATRARLNPMGLSLCALLIAPTLDVDLQLELAAAGKAQAAARESAPRAQSPVDLADLLLRQFRETAKGSDHRRVLAIAHAVADLPGGPKAEALYEMARRHSHLGEREKAFSSLSRAVEAGFADAGRLSADSAFVALRGDRAYAALVARLARPQTLCRPSTRAATPLRRPPA